MSIKLCLVVFRYQFYLKHYFLKLFYGYDDDDESLFISFIRLSIIFTRPHYIYLLLMLNPFDEYRVLLSKRLVLKYYFDMICRMRRHGDHDTLPLDCHLKLII